MSAKSFSEQISNLQYIIKFVLKSALSFTLISLLFIYNSLLRCFLLFCTFLDPSLSWFFILALVPPEHPWAPGLWECWGSGRADGEQSERGSSALVPMPFPALQFCPSPLVLLELWIWKHIKPTSVQLWKKKGASLMTSAIHPPSITFLISGVAFTVSAEFGCKLEGTSRSAQRDSSFHQVCPHLEMESGSASLRLAALWLPPCDLK